MSLDRYTQFLKGLFRRKRIIRRRDPLKDWKIILMFFSSMVLVVIALTGYLFYEINRGEIFRGSQKVNRPRTLERSALEGVINEYNDRESKLIDRKIYQPETIDPSE